MMILQEAEAEIMNTDSKRVLIVGLGKTGLSCARYLSAQGIEVAVTDSREHPPAMAALHFSFRFRVLKVLGHIGTRLKNCHPD